MPVEGKYCSTAGNIKGVSKITRRSHSDEISSRWLGFDNQFGRTFLGLTLMPGEVAHAYLGGNRVSYLRPLRYYFIISFIGNKLFYYSSC
ncbi:DUF3667 domain-containing protein [Cesiribacter sp. SM1]|uniref:DUF3667 domain-containing protein n=1 Tax=Cesiribacter sp. SM1 TaxID=2861196 RepID=UPI001CD1F71C